MKKIGAFLLLLITLIGCGKEKKKKDIKEIVKPVVTEKLSYRTMNKIFKTDAIFTPKSQVDHRTNSSGTIEKILKNNGEHVKKGDLIIVLDDQNTKSNYNITKTAFQIARNNYIKFKKLYNENLISYLDYVKYENSYIKAKGDYAIAKDNYDKLHPKAQISGVVGNLFGKIGEKVANNSSLFTVVDDSEMETYVGLPANMLNEIKLGEEVNVSVPAIDKTFVGYIVEINPIAQKDTKNYLIKIKIDNKNESIKDGMYGYVTVPLGKKSGLAINDEAIFVRDLHTYVYKIVDGRARKVEVKVEATNLPYSQISSPELKNGDKIITQGIFGLDDGTKVKEGENE